MSDRVDFIEDELDEIVSTRGAHLERMGENDWFLLFHHRDGTETAIWFESSDLHQPNWETRAARPIVESGEKP